jgi:hypothetical protein
MIRFERIHLVHVLSRRRFCFGPWQMMLFLLLFGFFVSGGAHGEEIDRLIAAVNGKVITEGDLGLARSLNALMFYGKASTSESQEDELNRLIDLELMRQELKNFSLTQEDEVKVKARMQSLRDSYADKGGLPILLSQLGLQESELISYLRLEFSILKFVDFRFKPFINVSEEEIKAYYEGKLSLQLRKSNLDLPALTQVSAKIEEILKEEKTDAVLEQWINEIRRNARIEYFDEK